VTDDPGKGRPAVRVRCCPGGLKGRDSLGPNGVRSVAVQALSEGCEGDRREPSIRNGERSDPWSE